MKQVLVTENECTLEVIKQKLVKPQVGTGSMGMPPSVKQHIQKSKPAAGTGSMGMPPSVKQHIQKSLRTGK